jgi:hypothetical protein
MRAIICIRKVARYQLRTHTLNSAEKPNFMSCPSILWIQHSYSLVMQSSTWLTISDKCLKLCFATSSHFLAVYNTMPSSFFTCIVLWKWRPKRGLKAVLAQVCDWCPSRDEHVQNEVHTLLVAKVIGFVSWGKSTPLLLHRFLRIFSSPTCCIKSKLLLLISFLFQFWAYEIIHGWLRPSSSRPANQPGWSPPTVTVPAEHLLLAGLNQPQTNYFCSNVIYPVSLCHAQSIAAADRVTSTWLVDSREFMTRKTTQAVKTTTHMKLRKSKPLWYHVP